MERIRVLLVEDDEDDYILTESLLSEINTNSFDLDWVTTYDAALEALARDNHDVCLLDYRLGARTGLDLLRETQLNGSRPPIILLTGQGDREIDMLAMEAGAADYLVKNQLNANQLERSIRYAIQQKRAEEDHLRIIREQEKREYAESANRAKDDFIAMVSHELRTPLSAMLGWVRILRAPNVDEATQQRALDAIERSAKAQQQLIEDLLDASRIAHGALRLETRPVELVGVIESALDAVQPSAETKGVELGKDFECTHCLVNGDPDRLQQGMNNLLTNAIKFTPRGGRVITCLRRLESSVQVQVSDTGCGISAEMLPHIFERYRQSENAPSQRRGGLGLGLAIVKHIVELHGGTVTAASEGEGKGATFTVELPVI